MLELKVGVLRRKTFVSENCCVNEVIDVSVQTDMTAIDMDFSAGGGYIPLQACHDCSRNSSALTVSFGKLVLYVVSMCLDE